MLYTFLLIPFVIYVTGEWFGPLSTDAYQRLTGLDGEAYDALVWWDRVLTGLSAFSLIAAMILGQQREQEQTEAQLATREEEALAAREVAEQAARAKSTFLATMSHEIRTPMNGVLGMVQLLRQTELNADQREMLETVGHSGDALLAILNDILDFSKIEAGAMRLESISFEPAAVGRRVVTLLGAQASGKGIGLTLDAEPGWVLGDPGRYQQILFNLVGNAIKFTGSGAVSVVIRLTEGGGAVSLRSEVHDTGIGLSEEERARLFQPFQQAESSTSRRFGGTGLGLVICRRLAEAMGGGITVDSEKGRGSTFTLATLHAPGTSPTPIAASNRAPSDAAPPGDLATLRVLVADDNAVNRQIAGRMLARLGIPTVGFAIDGVEALAALEREPWDLVLMDGEMPNLDGYAATERWRATEAATGRRARIIALTAGAFAEDRERALAAGMDDFPHQAAEARSAARRPRGRAPRGRRGGVSDRIRGAAGAGTGTASQGRRTPRPERARRPSRTGRLSRVGAPTGGWSPKRPDERDVSDEERHRAEAAEIPFGPGPEPTRPQARSGAPRATGAGDEARGARAAAGRRGHRWLVAEAPG